jgi:hypothetical protein
MANLPDRIPPGIPHSRQLARAARAQERTELAVLEHQLAALYDRECAVIDSDSITEVTKHSLTNVLGVLDFGLEKAGNDRPAAREIVARAVQRLEHLDDAAIMSRYGR